MSEPPCLKTQVRREKRLIFILFVFNVDHFLKAALTAQNSPSSESKGLEWGGGERGSIASMRRGHGTCPTVAAPKPSFRDSR